MDSVSASVCWFTFTRIGGAIILRYHRVADLDQDPHATAVTPARFRAHMEILRQRFHPVRLEKVANGDGDRRRPPRSVAVTFDDGYEDNLSDAKPILEEYEVPATVFVTTGFLDASREFWWDVLEQLLLRPGKLPSELSLSIRGRRFGFDLGDSASYSEVDWRNCAGWNWRADSDPTRRQTLFRTLSDLLRPLRHADRQAALSELTSWAGQMPVVRSAYRPLTREQVSRLSDGGLVAVGAHSVTHPLLSRLSPEEQWQEISESKADLERTLGRPVSAFAYPYGVVGKTAALVRSAGYALAVGTSGGLVFTGRRRYRLPRLYAGNWSGDEFEGRIRAFE